MSAIVHLTEVDSTNDELQRMLQANHDGVEEGLFVYADVQTKGRGQGGSSWESEWGKNLTGTFVLFPDFLPAGKQFLITQIGALAVADFLSLYCKLTDITVKWPNDVYWKDKKISGTLNEALLMGHSIDYVLLGIGINLNQKEFLSDAPNPVSVYQITSQLVDIPIAATQLQQCLLRRYMQLANEDVDQIRSDYDNRLYRREGYYCYEDKNGLFSAKIVKVHPSGEFELELENGERRKYLFKEVSFVL